jgi:carbon monoxide dehydrogenase subunit G
MEITKTFLVRTNPDAVWKFLTDPERVARCLPGAAITGKVDEQTYTGTITVKVGPVSSSYKGRMRFERLDAATRSADIVASGQDVRGKGGADMRMASVVTERSPGETEVVVTSEVNVVGILAQFGRGMIQDVSDQLFEKFTEAARRELETPATDPAPASAPGTGSTATDPGVGAPAVVASSAALPPIDVLSLGAGAIGRAARRAVRRPVVWMATVAAAVAVIYWSRRR